MDSREYVLSELHQNNSSEAFSKQARPSSRFGFHFATLSATVERLVQHLSVALLLTNFLVGGSVTLALFHYLFYYTSNQWVPLLYMAWFLYDWNPITGSQGGRSFQWLRSQAIYKHAARNFPVTLIRTTELPPDQSYLMCHHPHGIMPFGAFLSFGTNALGFPDLFPGLTPRLLTVRQNFWLPWIRELHYGLGLRASTKESMEQLLSHPKGLASVLVVGGAYEALEFSPNEIKLYLNKRKGFVKLALRYGRDLVPIFSFGEAFAYKQVTFAPGSHFRRFQEWLVQHIAFSIFLFYGRALFGYFWTPVPFRQPINVVVGKPFKVKKIENPSSKDIEQTHQQYVEAVNALYDQYNPIYGDPKIRLVIG